MAPKPYTPRELLERQRAERTPIIGEPMQIVTDTTMTEAQVRAALEISQRDNALLIARLRAADATVDAARDLANTADLAQRQAGRLLDQVRTHARELTSQLEDERKETARLRGRVAELLEAATGKHACPACGGPNGYGTQTACIDCEPGIGNPLRERPS